MTRLACWALLLMLVPVGAGAGVLPVRALSSDAVVERIAFGSCSHQDRPQPVWDVVRGAEPDVVLLMGDNVYADSKRPRKIQAAYDRFSAVAGFQALRETVPLLATWDDHDFGADDAGAEFPAKRASQQIFLDFFGVPAGSPRRAREGVYHAGVFGPEGKRTQIILLDTRFHRGPLVTGEIDLESGLGRPGGYEPTQDPAATVLGDTQWGWLERQLSRPAELRVIVSSIQLVAEDHRFERWANFPRERARMLELIARTGARGVVFLSGDRHSAELSVLPAGAPDNPTGYPIHDVTASSWNAPRPFQNEINRHRAGAVYWDENFGILDIAWDAPAPTVSIQIRKQDGTVAIRHDVPFDTLAPRSGSAEIGDAP